MNTLPIHENPNVPAARISILISTHNRAALLTKTLQSIYQLTPPAHEIIVINDGSTDNTPQVLSEQSNRIRFENRSNSGKSSAINRAAFLSTGDWIWICDDDDEVPPDAIAKFSSAIYQDSAADFIYGGIGWLTPSKNGEFEINTPLQYNLPKPDDLLGCLLVGQWIPSLCPIAIRRAIFLKIGGLSEKLRRVEDEEFALRLLTKATGASVNDCVYLARQHNGIRGAGSFSFSNEQREEIDLKSLRSIYNEIYSAAPINFYRITKSNPHQIPAVPLIVRMLTMFRVCHWEKCLADVIDLQNHKLSAQETSDISYRIALSVSTFTRNKITDLFRSQLWNQLIKCNSITHTAILVGIRKGLFWSIRNANHQKTGITTLLNFAIFLRALIKI